MNAQPQTGGISMGDSEVHRFLGALDARQALMEKRVDLLESSLRDMRNELSGKLDDVKSSVDASNGGRRAVAWMVGVLGGLTALLTTLYHIGVIR